MQYLLGTSFKLFGAMQNPHRQVLRTLKYYRGFNKFPYATIMGEHSPYIVGHASSEQNMGWKNRLQLAGVFRLSVEFLNDHIGENGSKVAALHRWPSSATILSRFRHR
jgi:hypothetical protein